MKLNEFIKPDEEDRYWEKPVVDDLWAIDKLILSKKLCYPEKKHTHQKSVLGYSFGHLFLHSPHKFFQKQLKNSILKITRP